MQAYEKADTQQNTNASSTSSRGQASVSSSANASQNAVPATNGFGSTGTANTGNASGTGYAPSTLNAGTPNASGTSNVSNTGNATAQRPATYYTSDAWGTSSNASSSSASASMPQTATSTPQASASMPQSSVSTPQSSVAETEKSQADSKGKFRFPWQKDSTSKQEVDDPFGPASLPETPAYQDLSQLPDAQTSPVSSTGSLGASTGAVPSTPNTGTAPMTSFAPVAAATTGTAPSAASNYSEAFQSAVHSPGSPAAPTMSASAPSVAPTAVDAATLTVAPTAPVGTAVTDDAMARRSSNAGAPAVLASAPESLANSIPQTSAQSMPQYPAADAMLARIPAAQADTTKLAGEGIQFYANGQTLARVGTEVVLAGDIIDTVDSILEANADKIPPEAYDLQREMLIRNYLDQAIETKLVYCDVLRNLPAEGLKTNIELIDNLFESEELPSRMKKAGITLRDEYEALLESQGTTIQRQKFLFRELVLCHQWSQQSVTVSKEVSPPELLDYYKAHIADFETPAEATWEELVVKKSKFRSRDEAYREMVRIGSMVAVDHQPFADVAKEFSQGVTAKTGGERPWVKTGELASKPLEDAVFSQPVGQLSAEIIEDDTCFYVIRVKERHEKVTEPFVDAQVQIRKSIVDERTEAARKAYIDRLRKEIPVFTVFDGIPSPEERAKAQKQGAFGRVH